MDHTTITSSPTFCSAPWTGLNIDQTGRVFPCMHTGYTLGNIKEQDINQILVDKPIQELKNSMRCGQWHEACRWCKELEETTGASGRTQKHAELETLASINADIDWFEPQHMTINWSNLCNLTCVYCNPETSTAWQSVKGVPINFVRNGHKSLLNIMKQKGHALQGLTLGGGEPLLQKGLVEMLQCLDSQKVNVLLTTNLSVELETNDVYQELRSWPNVSWMVSFDNADKDKFEYVRDRASWPQLEKNIQTLKRDNQHVIAHPAYSIYNAFDLVEYYEYCEHHNLDIFWCELTHPWDLDARRLSKKLRKIAINEIDTVIERWQHAKNLATTTLENYRKQLLDNSYIFNIDEHKTNVLQWHKQVEQQLNKTNSFDALWPSLAKEINNESI